MHGTAGNFSLRDPDADLIANSPSGMPYPSLTLAGIVTINEDARM